VSQFRGEKMKMKNIVKALALASIVSFAYISNANAAVISLVPNLVGWNPDDTVIVNVGDTFSLTVQASEYPGGTSGGGVSVDFSAGTGFVNADAVTMDATVWNIAADTTIDNGAGVVTAEALGFPGTTASTFDLAVITFTATSLGNFAMTMSESVINPFFLSDGITLANPTFAGLNVSVVPIPPAIWLLGSGLVGLIGMARRKRNLVAA